MSTNENPDPDAQQPRDPFLVGEVSPGTYDGLYDIYDAAGLNQIGSLVEVAGSNIPGPDGVVWLANQAYWKWTAGSAFPSGFVLRLEGFNQLPNWTPASANPILTCGPFGSARVAPVTGGRWWNVAIQNNQGSQAVGWLNQQQDGTLSWYSFQQRSYLTIGAGEQLVFATNPNGPTNAMYASIDRPV